MRSPACTVRLGRLPPAGSAPSGGAVPQPGAVPQLGARPLGKVAGPLPAGTFLAAAALLLAALGLGSCAAPKRVLAPAPGAESPPGGMVAADTAGVWRGEAAAALALRQIGVPYRPGGAGPRGFDCSGLVMWVYREQGLELPRTVREQVAYGPEAPGDGLAPGDLLFFRLRDGPAIDHVGIHVGDGAFVHAPGRGRSVRRERLDPWWRPKLAASRRPWSKAGQ